ncbi:MAG TPA: hypothetical protein VGJ78_15695 [Vicinamibacterales bacterium]|jgi:hypothetical protein
MKFARALATLVAGVVMFGASAGYGQETPDSFVTEASPFGLKQGMSVEQLGGQAASVGGGMYKLTSVPLPHPDLEFYVAQVSPRSGLCYIKGVGKAVRTSAYGTELRRRFENMRDEISVTYGRYRTVDLLLSDSMWEGPRDWMAGLAERERLLFAHWNEETRATLRPHLTSVFVGASAKNSESGYLVVEYYFDNEPGCQQEIEDGLQAAGYGLQQEHPVTYP